MILTSIGAGSFLSSTILVSGLPNKPFVVGCGRFRHSPALSLYTVSLSFFDSKREGKSLF